MNRLSAPRRSASAKWALVLASIGFAYSLATSGPPASANAPDASPRALTTNCTRPPLEFVTASDLGAVVVGSQLTRQVIVRFGFRPYTFKIGNSTGSGGNLTISGQGTVKGALANQGGNTFEVLANDNQDITPHPPISRIFSITSVAQDFLPAPLRYETGAAVAVGTTEQTIVLPVAVAGNIYNYSLSPNGGRPPYTYQVLEQPGGRFMPQGLAFDTTTGVIFGKPAAPTPIGQPAKIDILLTDASGFEVTGHFMLDIQPGTITSLAVATSGKMQLQFGNALGRDSLSLSMIIDKSELNALGIRTPADLNGLSINMNFGGQKLPPDARPKSKTVIDTTFNAQGEINVPNRRPVEGDVVGGGIKDVTYSIKLNPATGVLTARFNNLQMIRNIGANFLTFEGQFDPVNRGPVIPIDIRLGLTAGADLTGTDHVLEKTDVIKFVYKRSNGVGLGTASFNDNLAPAGIFLINKVNGVEKQVVTDVTNNIKEDRIFLTINGLMRQPGGAPITPQTGDSVSVFINRFCLGMFPASSFAVMGNQLVFSNANPSKGLQNLIIDNGKGTVQITTHGLNPSDNIFDADILIGGEPETVPITLTIGGGGDPHNATFDGQSTVTVFRQGNNIKNK